MAVCAPTTTTADMSPTTLRAAASSFRGIPARTADWHHRSSIGARDDMAACLHVVCRRAVLYIIVGEARLYMAQLASIACRRRPPLDDGATCARKSRRREDVA